MKNYVNIFVIFFISFLTLACSEKSANIKVNSVNAENKDTLTISKKLNGVSFVSERDILKAEELDPIVEIHANAIAFSPFAHISKDSPTIRFNSKHRWQGETSRGIITAVNEAKKKGLTTMVKPQLWGWDIFTGTINYEKNEDWVSFENDYEDYILEFAKVADSAQADIFCIGTELADFVEARPDFWHQLIVKVKAVYTGKLTYAENWDAFDQIPFASELDYIGVDAYFPLSEEIEPTIAQYEAGWKDWKQQMKSFSDKTGKPILFTEWGYRSIDKNGAKPWEFGNNPKVNMENQSKAYQATFNQFWDEDWFAGGFLWKWFPNHKSGGDGHGGFTPQNKPSINVLKKQFSSK